MTRIPGIKRLFRLDRKQDVDRAVDDELRFHLESTVEELVGQGWDATDARREAERRFGDVRDVRATLAALDKGRVARRDRAEWWSGLVQDVRYALRGLRRAPLFTAGVVLTLGLGIGANATMFGIVDKLLLRTPRYLAAPGRTHRVYFGRVFDGQLWYGSNTGYKVWQDLRELTRSFDAIALFFEPDRAVGTGLNATVEKVDGVSADFWWLFDARPAAGRFFTAADDTLPRGTDVAVLSWAYWQRAYGGRPNAVGSRVQIGSDLYTIIGVAPRGFEGFSQRAPAAFVPVTAAIMDGVRPHDTNPTQTYGWQWPEIMVRRRPGVTLARADADLAHAFQVSYARRLVEQPEMRPAALAHPTALAGPVLRDRGPEHQSGDVQVAVWLLAVSGIVLLIACANVGNLLLARAFGRRREIAVRLALGVRRSRLLRQLLAESLVLALLGGGAGVVVAQWGGGIMRGTLLPDAAWDTAWTDPRVLGFAAAVALLAGLLAGLAPAWFAGRTDLAGALKAGVREGTYHRSRTRTALLVMQGALTAVLLVGAGLFVRSFRKVQSVPLGFDADRLLVVSLTMRGVDLDSARAGQLRDRLHEAAAALPGVAGATRALTVPFWNTWDNNLFVPGEDTARLNRMDFTLQAATPDYFATTGTRLLRGRGIEAGDVAGSPAVMVVSDSMAKAIWRGQDPIGKCVKFSQDNPCTTVVGVAENVKHSDFKDDPGLNYYLSSAQWRPDLGGLMVRTPGPAANQAEAVRRALQSLMPGQSYVTVQPITDFVDPEMRQWQLGATMFTVFGLLALVVAAVGLYSVIAYGVAQRTHELGVRVALGARMGDLVRLVVGQGLRLALVSAVLGVAAAAFAARWIAPLLFDTSPRDPFVLAGVAAVLIVVSGVASLVPALRAARVSPNVALRDE